MDIKKVEIGYLKNSRKTGIIQNSMSVYKLEKQITKEKICFIVGDMAIDIDDFNNTYYIIKRNDVNQILPNQTIHEETEYALNLNDLSKDDLSLLKKINYKKKEQQYKKMNR